MSIRDFPYMCILYTVYSPNFTYLVARYKYSHLVIGSAPYFGSTFIAEPPKNHAHSKCIGILAPCFSRVSLMYIYFTQCPPPFVHISSPVLNIPTSSSVPPRILIPLSCLKVCVPGHGKLWVPSCTKYMTFNTEPLRGQTKPLRTPNTHNHCVTPMENNCRRPCVDATWWKIHLRPHVYKGFPFISLSTHPIFSY